MVGNKYKADHLAKAFQERLNSLNKIKSDLNKVASQHAEPAKKKMKAEDFLISGDHSKKKSPASAAIDNEIAKSKKRRESEAKDVKSKSNCNMCGYAHDGQCSMAKDKKCKACKKAPCKCSAAEDAVVDGAGPAVYHAKDHSYLVDHKAAFVLSELGKVAADLRKSGKSLAADMVDVTAIEIKDEAIQKAASKLEVINGLKKMASESFAEGDRFTGDVILATINNIKKS